MLNVTPHWAPEAHAPLPVVSETVPAVSVPETEHVAPVPALALGVAVGAVVCVIPI